MRRLPAHMVGRRILGLTFAGDPIVEPRNAGSSLTFAAAGGGKTTCVSVPAIMAMLPDRRRAIFCNDVKDGEIAAQIGSMCVKHRRKFGIVDEFGLIRRHGSFVLSLNPFGSAVEAYKDDPDQLPFIIENIAHALIEEPADDAKNFYWRESPREIIDLGIRILLDRNPKLCFPGALHALIADPVTWGKALVEASHTLESSLSSAARQLLDMREENAEHYTQHMRAALTALKTFSYGPLRNAGRIAEVSHAQLIEESWIVCFVNPAKYAQRLGSFYALHFLALMNAQLRFGAGRADYILDEFTNAPLKDSLNRVTIQRAFDARSHFLAQSRQDIVRKYGEKETALLEENCTIKVWLKFSNFEEAERVSKAMGEAVNVNRGLGFGSDKPDWSINYSTGHQRVFTADELMRLPPGEQILHLADVGFIHCRKIRQNQIGPFCFDLDDNPLEGGRLPPEPLVIIPADDPDEGGDDE